MPARERQYDDGVSTPVVIDPGDEIVAETTRNGTNTTMRLNRNGTFNHGRAVNRGRITAARGNRDALR